MKIIRAIIRPESTQRVIEALEKNSIYAMTRMNRTHLRGQANVHHVWLIEILKML